LFTLKKKRRFRLCIFQKGVSFSVEKRKRNGEGEGEEKWGTNVPFESAPHQIGEKRGTKRERGEGGGGRSV
jgi:hypothetical protein